MPTALVREVSESIAACELTHVERVPISYERAVEQHAAYATLLEAAGWSIERLPTLHENPDSVFVEDTAIVLPELAIVTRPGAPSRRSETRSVADALAGYRRLVFIEAPGTIDGGDVLVGGRAVYVGASSRSNPEAVRQLREALGPFGYEVCSVPLQGCLHLKSAASLLPGGQLLYNPEWVDPASFRAVEAIPVNRTEPAAANALVLGHELVMDGAHGATVDALRRAGHVVHTVDLSELAKAEGAVTCCSVLIGS